MKIEEKIIDKLALLNFVEKAKYILELELLSHFMLKYEEKVLKQIRDLESIEEKLEYYREIRLFSNIRIAIEKTKNEEQEQEL